MTRPSTQGRFPSARSAPFVLADLVAQCAVEGVTIYREWKTVGDPRTRAQAYFDLKKRFNDQYGRGIATAFVSGEYGKFAGDTPRQAFAREYMQEVVPPTPEEYEKAIRDGKVWATPRGPDGLYPYQREMVDLIRSHKGPFILDDPNRRR